MAVDGFEATAPAQRRRVVHLIKGLGRGGAEMLLQEGLRCSDRDRFEYSYIYLLPWKDALVPGLRDQGAKVRCVCASRYLGYLAAVPRVALHLRRNRIELVHAHLPVAGIVARLAGRLAGVPVVYTEHNLLERYHPVTRRLHLATWGLQAAVVAVSREVERSVRTAVGGRVPVVLVVNGIPIPAEPTAEAQSEARREIGLPDDAEVVGLVAAFRVQKRLDCWLDVARRIAEERPSARFLLVGDGPERPKVEAMSAEAGLAGRLILTGLRDDVARLLPAMDVFLLTSDHEGLPLAVLEAMASRLPVVATAVGGVPEAVVHGETGIVVASRGAADLADAVLRLLDNPSARARFGAAGRERVAARFSVERMTRQLEAVYDEVLGGTV